MNIAVFGGCFDPLHLGHKEIAFTSLKVLNIDILLIIPTYQNPIKSISLADASQRLKWAQRVFKNEPKIQVLDIEAKEKKPSYSINTVKKILYKYKQEKIYFLIGADNIASMHKWHDIENLKKIVEFVIIKRAGYAVEDIEYKTIDLHCDISSSYFRETLDLSVIPKEIQREVALYYK